MGLFDKFSGLFKREVDKDTDFYTRMDIDAFFSSLNNLWKPSELINKLGGRHNFELLTKDADIFAALDKRIAALLDTKLTLAGGDPALNKWFTEQLLPFERQLKQDFFWTAFNGYGVEQIIYDEDGSGRLSGFQREEFWRFLPLKDLIHVKCVHSNDPEYRDQVMPYGKFVLTTNNGTSYNPMGDSIAERLITPWIFKCNGADLWMDFAKRFANGFMHAKIEDVDQKEAVREALEKAGKSAIIVTDKNSDLILNQPNRDSSLYLNIDERTVKAIQKVILGETQTSDMQDRGGSMSSSIHNEVRLEKTRADIDMVEDAINEVILQVALVNGFIKDERERFKLPKAAIIYDPSFNMELATRDSTLRSMGVKFSKSYYIKNYGFTDDDFEIEEQQPSFFSVKKNNKRSFLTHKDVDDYLGRHTCSHHNFQTPGQKEVRYHDEVDQIVSLVDRNAAPPLDPEDLISAILTSNSEQELNQKMLALMDNKNNAFVDTMTEALYLSAGRGALLGNPKVLPNE